ncbi:hypothetical protein [Bartonella harrusi]|uniref:Uncharacterized protein n=1 Tax=Bartonella harrusi TaxID=2961895 RepID=A0ABY5EUD1_9HYPH|nr:hypothetical protein [Bartonella harrusi]UTO28030.1 hypothetical protein NMK50_07405 [Bartonella harrusi]
MKSRMCLSILTASIRCFVQTVKCCANSIKVRFQEGTPVATIAATGEGMAIEVVEVIKAIDMAVIRDAEGQDRFAFGKTENVSLFKAFWGGVGL